MEKSSRDSELTLGQVMLPSHSNVAGNVFGGEILKIMDSVAYAVAMKHSEGNVVTARIDEIMFHQPIFIGSVVKCNGKVVFTGKSSIEVCITVDVDDIQNRKICYRVLTAYFTMVAVDENNKPKTIPQLELIDEEEIIEFSKGKERYEKRKLKNKQNGNQKPTACFAYVK
ncbi:acyl-CoA thioesterase [Clostridium algoriphilum]|uniref:acyl-CoA thioesterase n=1 Tax=Clostridium algoriphilum TaxID=198347 RepID=UPI001CF5B96A|nr:acyl-CoA thioesterase [Clostridium algoriphilum]MCB2293520.1 acyl-CoA thioesterase [Clostridium algoriphilum]